jgi:hypothetical protein
VTRVALAVKDAQTSLCFQDEFDVTFSALKFPHDQISPIPGMDSYLRFRQFVSQARVPAGLPFPKITETFDGKIVLTASTPSILVLSIPPGARTFHFGYGLLNDNYFLAATKDPALFSIQVEDATNSIDLSLPTLWAGQINPPDLKDHPGLRETDIDLPKTSKPSVLILQALLAPSKISSDNCWSDFEFR